MCDPRDLGRQAEVRSPFNRAPTVYLYEQVAGGVGLAEKLYAMHGELLAAAVEHLAACPCQQGCPSCVGTVDLPQRPKQAALRLLRELVAGGTRAG